MYGLVVPDAAGRGYALATWRGAVLVGTRDEVARWRGQAVLLPDAIGPWVLISEVEQGTAVQPGSARPADAPDAAPQAPPQPVDDQRGWSGGYPAPGSPARPSPLPRPEPRHELRTPERRSPDILTDPSTFPHL